MWRVSSTLLQTGEERLTRLLGRGASGRLAARWLTFSISPGTVLYLNHPCIRNRSRADFRLVGVTKIKIK